MTEFVEPSIEYFELWPLLVVFGVACLGVVVEAFLPRSVRYTAQVVLALGGLVLGLAEVFAVQYIGSSWRDVIAFGLLFLILLVRPQGLLGARKVREV